MGSDIVKIINFIEGYYNRKLTDNEIQALRVELKGYTFEIFKNNLAFQLLKKVEYFTVQKLHQIIKEYQELENLKKQLGIKSFDELYEN